ncbi:MAG: DUF1830 domain-containing protein [Hydrococcus sp. RM1_1_31]|nr:DUF1830 domain-containing protein [Hydrococcus sp. RM1_1_31]
MSILNSLPTDCQKPILCCYVNTTSQIQIAQITNISDWYFERVVFPGQRLGFEAPDEAQLEIYTSTPNNNLVSKQFPCAHLRLYD